MKEQNTPLEQELWNRWMKHHSQETANDLIAFYMYLVSFHVERIGSHLPKSVSNDDVKSYALIGLYDAIKKFDPSRDLKFDTYASIRIRGAIMDGLRKVDWLPRTLRDKVKKVEKASQEYEQKYSCTPSSVELATFLNMTVEEVESALHDSLFSNILSIEEKPKQDTGNAKEGLGYNIPDDSAIQPESSVIHIEMKHELTEEIKKLNENEQMVISLFYFNELTLTEIGEVLNLTTSRISQIHKRAILKLRKTLSKLEQIS